MALGDLARRRAADLRRDAADLVAIETGQRRVALHIGLIQTVGEGDAAGCAHAAGKAAHAPRRCRRRHIPAIGIGLFGRQHAFVNLLLQRAAEILHVAQQRRIATAAQLGAALKIEAHGR